VGRWILQVLRSTMRHNCASLHGFLDLEGNPELNCGIGSNLNRAGHVECEAAYMSSEKLAFGAVACVSNCVNPVFAAKKLSKPYEDSCESGGLISPMILAGYGADKFCSSLGVGIVENVELSTTRSQGDFALAKDSVKYFENNYRLDTVGGVYINADGLAESCSSSGGIIFKKEGRIGHSPQFGSAIWSERQDDISISVSISGCGEALARIHMAEILALSTFNWLRTSESLAIPLKVQEFLTSNMCNSHRLRNFPLSRLLLGGLLLLKNGSYFELISFHNSRNFAFAFCDQNLSIKRYNSERPSFSSLSDFCCNSFIL